MNKNLLILIFAALFIVMIADLIFLFDNTVKAILYGGMFIVGMVIYLISNGFSMPKK